MPTPPNGSDIKGITNKQDLNLIIVKDRGFIFYYQMVSNNGLEVHTDGVLNPSTSFHWKHAFTPLTNIYMWPKPYVLEWKGPSP